MRDIIIAVVLLLVLSLGCVIFVAVDNDILSGEETTALAETTDGSGEASSSATTAGDYSYVEVGSGGYKTIDGTTYFFVKYEIPDPTNVNINFNIVDYGNYEAVLRYSYNLTNWYIVEEDVEGFAELPDTTSEYLYVSYCAVTNCADPEAVLLDLRENVFTNDAYYSVIVSDVSG
ncbi:MAG: hypothetical protein IJ038_05160 [Clostridia bacterium]|nr:hypothetical protein [Clostridia bacterium]